MENRTGFQGSAPADATYQPVLPPKPNPYIHGPVNAISGAVDWLGRSMGAGTAAIVQPTLQAMQGDERARAIPPGQFWKNVGRGFVLGEPPPQQPPFAPLPNQGTTAEVFKRAGFHEPVISPEVAAAIDASSASPIRPGTVARNLSGPEAAGFLSEAVIGGGVQNAVGAGVIGPVARGLGRAAEPLRQVPGIREAGAALSPGFAIKAYESPKFTDWLKYTLGDIPSEREAARSIVRANAGAGAMQGDIRAEDLATYNVGREAAMTGRNLTQNGADDFLRGAVEEYKRNPEILNTLTPEEANAVLASTKISENEVANRLGREMRPNELGMQVEQRAQIAEERLRRALETRRFAEQLQELEQPIPMGGSGVGFQKPGALPTAQMDEGAEAARIEMGLDEPYGHKIPSQPEEIGASETEIERAKRNAQIAESKARKSLGKFEEKSGIGFPRDVQSHRIDLGEAERMLAERGKYPVGYSPRILSDLGRVAESNAAEPIGRYGTPRGLSTALGKARKSYYHQPTSDVERSLLERLPGPSESYDAWRMRVGAGSEEAMPNVGNLAQPRYGDEAIGERARYFEPHGKALEMHGERMDRALEHGGIFQDFAARFKVAPGTPGARPMSEIEGAFTGFNKNAAARLQRTWIPEGQLDFLKQVHQASAPQNYGLLSHMARQSLQYWKPMVTLVRPEFWARNWAWSKFIQGAYGNVDPLNDAFGVSIVTQNNPAKLWDDMPGIPAMTQEQLREEFIRNRIIGASKAVDIGMAGIGHTVGPAYQRVEDALRASYARHLLRGGATMDEAARKVQQLMINYGPEAFTPLLNSIRRDWVPFASWSWNIPKIAGRTLGERPAAYGSLGALAGDVNSAVGLEPKDQAHMGKGFAERGGFALGPPDERGNVRGLTYSPIGFYDVQQWGPRPYHEGPLPDNLQGQADALTTMLRPELSGLASQVAGRNFLGGYNYDESKPVRLPTWAKYLQGKVPGIEVEPISGQPYGNWRLAEALKLAGPVPSMLGDLPESNEKARMSVMKFMTGLPLTSTNVNKNKRQERKTAKAERRDKKEARHQKRKFARNLRKEAQQEAQADSLR